MTNSWFRMYAEFATDPKVQMMSEILQRRLVMLFCIKCNGDVTLHDDEVAFQLRISPEEWQYTKAEFIKRGFIDDSNKILNWDKRQFRSDSSKERVRRHRDSKKKTFVKKCNVTVTPPDTDTDTDTDKKEKEFPDWFPLHEWTNFKHMRIKSKKPMTHHAEKLAIGKLERFKAQGYDPAEILNRSILNNWQDLFPPKDEAQYAAKRPAETRSNVTTL